MPIIDLTAGATIVLEAVDPTDGSPVTGVTISDGVLYADSHGGTPQDLDSPQPHYLPVDLGGD